MPEMNRVVVRGGAAALTFQVEQGGSLYARLVSGTSSVVAGSRTSILPSRLVRKSADFPLNEIREAVTGEKVAAITGRVDAKSNT